MLELTDNAKAVIRRLIERSDSSGSGLRISVQEGGCSGLKYMLGIDKAAADVDQVFEFDGVRVFVDPCSLPVVDGLAIDYVEDVDQSGFVFDNPNIGDRCACGKSFAP
ncbi:MAG: iron-sulfur cluster assembly accessory protein [Rhodospirillales bacterium]